MDGFICAGSCLMCNIYNIHKLFESKGSRHSNSFYLLGLILNMHGRYIYIYQYKKCGVLIGYQ